MFDFSKCHPIALDDLIRIGNKYDGGYVLSECQIKETDTVLSFGIRDDWSFEKCFSLRKDVAIYSYDYSTVNLPFLNEKLSSKCYQFIFGTGISILRRRFDRATHYLRAFQRANDFYNFFNGKKRHFIPKFIGQHDDEKNISFKTLFQSLSPTPKDLSVFLKMDIEGAEFHTLPLLVPFFDKLNGMAIEFHLRSKIMNFFSLLDVFSTKFYIAHVHGCNFGKFVKNTNIPEILEIVFINKKIVRKKATLSELEYPVKGLDMPCNRTKKDLKLTFTNNVEK